MPDPRRDEHRLGQMSRYLKHPKTIAQIRDKYKISERCAYRWIGYLREAGFDVVSRRTDSVKFSVVQ